MLACAKNKKMKIDAETDQMPEIDYSEDGMNGEVGMAEDERSNVDRSLSPSGKFGEVYETDCCSVRYCYYHV